MFKGTAEFVRFHKVRLIKTLVLYAVFVTIGLSCATPGPSMLDLKLSLGVSLEDIALLLPSRSGGYALGSIIVGLVINRVNIQLSLIICLVLSAIFLGTATLHHQLWAVLATFAVNGFVMGIVDTAGNVWCLQLWGKEASLFLQILHFAFGIGSMMGPILVRPFLYVEPADQFYGSNLTSEANLTTALDVFLSSDTGSGRTSNLPWQSTSNGTVAISDIEESVRPVIRVQYAFIISAAYTLLVSAVFVGVFLKWPQDEPHPSKLSSSVDNDSRTVSPKVRFLIICVATVFLHFFFALEIAMGSFLTPFAVEGGLHLSKATGTIINSLFWTTFTFFRIPFIFINKRLGLEKGITINLLLMVIGNLILQPFANKYEWALWSGVAIMGIGVSSIFAALLGYFQEHFTVTGSNASAFLVSGCVGEFVWPLIIGKLIDGYPDVFLYSILVCSASCVVLYALVVYLIRNHLHIEKK